MQAEFLVGSASEVWMSNREIQSFINDLNAQMLKLRRQVGPRMELLSQGNPDSSGYSTLEQEVDHLNRLITQLRETRDFFRTLLG